MKVVDTVISDLKLIQLDIHEDHRGFFVELFNKKMFIDLGLSIDYFQDNFSSSMPNVIRGLHYQRNPSQAKLVGCTRGRIWDVVVDIRKNSPTFGQYFGTELSGKNGKIIYIPSGFAHGFCVIGDEPADLLYKVSHPYCKEGDSGISYDDKDLAINWPIKNPIISDKDKALPSFKDYQNSNNTY